MTDTSKYQAATNGPLKQTAIDFLNKVRIENKFSYKALGEHLNISGPFAHAILNKPSNITTSTAMQHIAQGIEKLEGGDIATPENTDKVSAVEQMLDHTYHLRTGLAVKFQLPANVTPAEADRLCMFIKSIPWG